MAYNNRGRVYRKQEKYDLAIADYTKAIELDNKFADAYHNRGNVYDDLKKHELAIADYEKAAELYQKQENDTWYNKTMNKLEELRGS